MNARSVCVTVGTLYFVVAIAAVAQDAVPNDILGELTRSSSVIKVELHSAWITRARCT
jgi:hypothetical protein